jgi:zinc protease
VKNFKVAALKRFYHDWYRPDLMAVVAVGDVDPATLEKMINEHFGALTNPQHERPRNYPRMTRRAATEALVITDPEADGNSVLIRYPVQEMIDQSTYREYRRLLVESLFATMLNQRLQELTQLPNPPFLNGGSAMGRLVARYKSFTSSAALGERGAAPAIDALVQENERARKYGFSVAELERGKKNMLRSYEREYNEREKSDSSSYVGEYLRHFLENEAIPGIAREYEVVQELIPGISLDELNHFARDNVPANAAKLVVYMGSSKPGNITPAKAQLLASVAAAEKAVVRARDEKIVAENLMDKPPVPGSIVAESTDATLGLTRLTLSNGVKVILKPTDFRNDQVILSAVRFGGQSLFDDKDIFNARYASTILGTMGVANYAPLEVQKILAGKAVSVNVGLNNYTDNVSGTAGSSEIETMLQLVYLKMTSVRRDDDLFKSYVTRQAEAARNNMAQPEAVFRDSIVTTLYANNPRVPRAPRPDDFAKLSLDRSLDIYRQRFSSAKDLTFILVGSFDVATIKPLLATYLASLPTPDIPVAFRDVGVRPIKGVIKKQVRSGTEAKSDVSINFSGEAIYSEQEQLRFHAMLDVMNIRITDILREKMALIYGGGVSGSLNKFPYANYSIGASLPTGPDKVDKVIAATFAEIERMKEQGPDQSDLDKVKENWLQSYQKSLRENSYWAGRLQSALTNGTDPATILQYDKQVAALTPADLKEAARRYFDLNNYVQVVLQPEK